MRIIYKNKKIEKECNNEKIRIKKYGDEVSYKLFKLLTLIRMSPSFNDIYMFPQYRVHKLKGDRNEEYSLVISRNSKYRLIVIPYILKSIMNTIDLKNMSNLKVLEVSPHYE